MAVTIALDRVSMRYRKQDALADVTLTIGAGEALSILGPSGSGKSSLVRLILGLAAPSEGSIWLDRELASKDNLVLVPPEERQLAVVFQDLALWPHLSVSGNLEFGLRSRGVPKPERRDRIAAMLERVGLQGLDNRPPGELSGGERQRVAIARALVARPRAVLLDEPLANLDAVLKGELISLFKELLSEQKTTVVYVTHDLREAASLGDRAAVIENGRLVQAGSLAEIRRSPGSAFIEKLVETLE
jgi:ABC-type Fe3+/spermidine/putrescine transport system ATPase subunit